MIEPGVAELLGLDTDYPLTIGEDVGARPAPIYCEDGVPVVTPHGVFDVQRLSFGATLTELSGFSLLGVPQFRRGWYSGVTNNRNSLITVSNTSSRNMVGILRIWASQNFTFVAADKVANPWIAHYQVTVHKYPTGGTVPQAGYAGVGTNANVYQVAPTLEAQHYWDGEINVLRSARESAIGILPPLEPGFSYVVEPNIWVTEEPNNFSAAADTGAYTTAGMRMMTLMWSDMGDG